MKKRILASIFLAAIIWAVFGQTLHFDFVNYDDDEYVYENPIIAGGLHWHAIAWVFTHSLCANWHPVTWISHMLDCQLYGLHPGGHHLTSVLLHTATAILLFLWLEKFTRLRSEAAASSTLRPLPSTAPPQALWRCLFVAAVFAIHPLRVESVVWVAERKDVLSGFFFILTLWAYAEYAERGEGTSEGRGQGSEVRGQRSEDKHPTSNIQHPTSIETKGVRRSEVGDQKSEVRGPWSVVRGLSSIFPLPSSIFYLLSLSCFALGLMSKPMLVTVPFVLLLLDYWPLGRFPTSALRPLTSVLRLLLDKLPFLALAVASCVITVRSQHAAEAALQQLTVSWRIENALVAYVDYLWQMFYPVGLAVLYPLPQVHPPVWKLSLCVLVLAAVSICAIAVRRKQPWLLMGWLWYLGMLVPVIGLVQVGSQARADRYTYLPQIGLYLMAAWGAAEWCRTRRYPRAVLGCAGAAILAGLIAAAHVQTGYWRNGLSLWTHTLACTSGNWLAHKNLGSELEKQRDFDGAIAHYQQALQINPKDAQACYDWGIALAAQRKWPEAIEQYDRALQINPDYVEAHDNLGTVLAQQGRLAEAIAHYQRALQLKPDHAKAHVNLGNVLSAQGQWTEAVEHYQRALQIKPDYTLACYNLGNVLASHGKLAEAVPYFQRALTLATGQGNLPLAEAIRNRLQALPQPP